MTPPGWPRRSRPDSQRPRPAQRSGRGRSSGTFLTPWRLSAMLRCPFCHYDNEDGALFCEQCKSDLAGVEAPPVAAPAPAVPVAAPFVETVPVVEAAVVAEAM